VLGEPRVNSGHCAFYSITSSARPRSGNGILSPNAFAVFTLLAFAAINRRLTPRAASGESPSARLLVRSITIELVLAAVVLALVASWRFTPPPRSLLAAQAQPIHVHVHAAKAMADLQIEPPNATGQRITITLLDGEFRPLSAKGVVLTLSKPDAGIETLRLSATRHGDATWQIEGLRLPMSGRWHGRVEILVTDFEKTTIEDDLELR